MESEIIIERRRRRENENEGHTDKGKRGVGEAERQLHVGIMRLS